MPNLYNKLMAKDMPRAAAAPTSRQMVAAPMGLRSAMKRYAEGGETPPPPPEEERMRLMERMRPREEEARRPMETMRPPEMETRRPPEEPRPLPDTAPQPRYPDTAPQPVEVRPEIYPQDYAGPRVAGTSQTQQVGPRTSYRQEADGTLTEIGYNGQPVSGYTPEQWAMHNATMGINQPKFNYVWNGEGYTKVPAGAQTGYDSGTTTAPPRLEESYGPTTTPFPGQDTATMPMFPDTAPDPYTAPMPNYDIGYDPGVAPMKDYRPEPVYEPMPEPKYAYPESMPEPNYEQMPEPSVDPRMEMLRKALSGQGVSSIGNSQQLASLLQMLGYSK